MEKKAKKTLKKCKKISDFVKKSKVFNTNSALFQQNFISWNEYALKASYKMGLEEY